MLTSTGFAPGEAGTVTVVNEWPDVDTAVRALAAAGPSVPAIEAVGLSASCDALGAAITPLHVDGVVSGSLPSTAGSCGVGGKAERAPQQAALVSPSLQCRQPA